MATFDGAKETAGSKQSFEDFPELSGANCSDAFRIELNHEAAKVGSLAKNMIDGPKEQYSDNQAALSRELSKLNQSELYAVLDTVNSKSHWYDDNPTAVPHRDELGKVTDVKFINWTASPSHMNVPVSDLCTEPSAVYHVTTEDKWNDKQKQRY